MRSLSDKLIGHVSLDSTENELNEEKPKGKRGRPRKGEERIEEPTRLKRQMDSKSTRWIASDAIRVLASEAVQKWLQSR